LGQYNQRLNDDQESSDRQRRRVRAG